MLPGSDAYRDCKRLKDSQLALIGAIRQANGGCIGVPPVKLSSTLIPSEDFSPEWRKLVFSVALSCTLCAFPTTTSALPSASAPRV